jgi:uncharacterized protein (DUF885 family)
VKKLFACLLLTTAGCALQRSETPEMTFHRLADAFVAHHFALRPVEASGLGWHQYDGKFVIPTAGLLAAEQEELRQLDRQLAALPESRLSEASRHDRQILLTTIAKERFTLEAARSPYLNPMNYAGGLDVSLYIKRNWKPFPERVRDMSAILRQAPEFFGTARTNLDAKLPTPYVETAIEIATSTADFIENDIAKAVRECGDAAAVAEFNTAAAIAAKEHRAFADWLRRERLPQATPDFALGSEKYAAMLRGELIDLTPDRVLAIGLAELRVEQMKFAAAARVIDPTKPAIEVFKAIQKEHPTPEGLLPDTRKDLEAIRQFIVDHRLVTIPSEVRATVTETLPPFRATSFASMETPGPFETKATEAYYYVTPTETNWTAAQKEEWLTAFNYYTTDVVSIHEAYPGHYVQFLALNASPASTVQKVFGSYAFIEGWAHYTEQMVLDAGFGAPANPANATREELVRAAKYRLAQSDEALLRLCRLCVSVQMHCQGMTLEAGTRFFVDNCHYEEKPAHSEALRGTFDPGYCFYTLGKLQLLKLRADWQAQEGAAFTLQRFHDEVLRHGTPPVRLLRNAMLKNAEKQPELF